MTGFLLAEYELNYDIFDTYLTLSFLRRSLEPLSLRNHDEDVLRTNIRPSRLVCQRRNFNLLERLDVEPVIAIRNNASTRERGCQLRRDEVLLIKKLGYQRWKQMKDAGRRWIAEIVFSSIKRVLGEDLLSKKFKAQKVEASMKILLCKPVFYLSFKPFLISFL
jgi:hypothetical protein